MKGKTGAQLSLKSKSPLLNNKTLEADYLNSQLAKTEALSHKPTKIKRDGRCGQKGDLSDEHIAEMRGDYEIRLKTLNEIAEKFSVSYNRAYMIIDYRTRADVDAK